VKIVASTPAWNEDSNLLGRCERSVYGVVDRHYVYAGGIARLVDGGRWATQGAMRDHGRQWAQERRARWFLQLDADEALVNGELLRAILERWAWPAYPLAYVQEDGQTTLAPFKCFRLPARIVACSEYVQLGRPGHAPARSAPVWNLAGYACPLELRACLLELPFVFHTPSLRSPPIRRAVRLSRDELSVEPRPDAIQWPLPSLTLNGRSIMPLTDEGGSIIEHELEDGDYACPGCGARYDTPGICTGQGESPHEPMTVTAVAKATKKEKEKKDDDAGGADPNAAAGGDPGNADTAAAAAP